MLGAHVEGLGAVGPHAEGLGVVGPHAERPGMGMVGAHAADDTYQERRQMFMKSSVPLGRASTCHPDKTWNGWVVAMVKARKH